MDHPMFPFVSIMGSNLGQNLFSFMDDDLDNSIPIKAAMQGRYSALRLVSLSSIKKSGSNAYVCGAGVVRIILFA